MKRIGVKIALLIGAVEILAMAVLFAVIDRNVTNILEDRVIRDMNMIADDHAELVESYITGRCEFLEGYARATEVREVLLHPDDPGCIAAAREFTLRYAEGYDNIEGLYTAEWDTYVLAHINSDSVDKTFREGDAAKDLENSIRSAEGAFCTGVVLAPVTKQMVMPVYAPVKDLNGEMTGFAGAAFYPEGLGLELAETDEQSFGYSILNCANNVYIYDNDETLVGTECDNPVLLDSIAGLRAASEDGNAALTENGEVMSLYYMPERDWVFVISEKEDEVFRLVNTVRFTMVISFLLITVFTVLLLNFSVSRMMSPINEINSQILRLKASDFSHGHGIERIMEREDEFGTIANAVGELQVSMENRNELFKEMLDAQTAGMVVSMDTNSEIIMINQMALKLYGIDESEKDSITIEGIRSRFTEEELAHIDEQLQKVTDNSEEVMFESPITYADGSSRYLLTHVKTVSLSNGDRVTIYSLMDISERKKLEEDLLIQSETDFLTGICNRRSGEFRIAQAIEKGFTGMFCLFDANKFKHINDTYGHNAGDEVLIGIAKAMETTFRSSDILIRLGGDEFVVFAPNMPNEKVGSSVIERFMNNISNIAPASIQGHKVTISLGAVMVEEEMSFSEMYARADSLMYECKKKGGNAYAFYHEES